MQGLFRAGAAMALGLCAAVLLAGCASAPSAIGPGETALTQDRSGFETSMSRVQMMLASGRPHRALELLRALGSEAAGPEETFAVHNLTGVTLDRLARFEEAEAAYRAAHALQPGDPGVLNNWALSCLLRGDRARARLLFAALKARAGRSGEALPDQVKGNLALLAQVGGRQADGPALPAPGPYAPRLRMHISDGRAPDGVIALRARLSGSDPYPLPRL